MRKSVVFHIENSPVFSRSFCNSIRGEAVDIRSFRNSAEAESALKLVEPDIVFSDTDGEPFVKRLTISTNPTKRNIPVVFLCGTDIDADRDPDLSKYPLIRKADSRWVGKIADAINVARFVQQNQRGKDVADLFKVLQTSPEMFHEISMRMACSSEVILERLEGVVDRIEEHHAFVTLRSEHGEELVGEYPALEFQRLGIRERRRFICETVESASQGVQVRLTKIPEIELTEDDELAIDREIEELVAD